MSCKDKRCELRNKVMLDSRISFGARGYLFFVDQLLEENENEITLSDYDHGPDIDETIATYKKELAHFKYRDQLSFRYKGVCVLLTKTWWSIEGDVSMKSFFYKTYKIKIKSLEHKIFIKTFNAKMWTLKAYPPVYTSPLKPTCGIYKITNIVNGRVYIGQSTAIEKRYTEHVRGLLSNKHHNEALQKDFNKYGAHKFTFEILQECKPKSLDIAESLLCHEYNVWDSRLGYNVAKLEDYSTELILVK